MASNRDSQEEGATSLKPVVYLSAKTQYENLGDCIILGALVELLRERGDVRVINGNAPSEFLRTAGIRSDELATSSEFKRELRSHLLARVKRQKRRKMIFAYKGGGVVARSSHLPSKSSVKSLVLALGFRILGVQQVRLGFSYSATSGHLVERMRHRLMDVAVARDDATARTLGLPSAPKHGDLAAVSSQLRAEPSRKRRYLVVSFRAVAEIDKASEGQLATKLRETADRLGLEVVPVAQVGRDYEALCRWSEKSGFGEPQNWDGSYEGAQKLLSIYRQTALVVSDRLHALLFGLYSGATPLAVTDQNSKVGAYFMTNGMVSLVSTASDLVDLLGTTDLQKEVGYVSELPQRFGCLS